MHPEDEAGLRASFTEYYEADRRAKQQLQARDSRWAATNEGAWRIAAQYRRLRADDPRRIGWQYLLDLADRWDRDPEAMTRQFDEIERNRASGTPQVSDLELRHYRQVHLLHFAATHPRSPSNPQRGNNIERWR